MTPIRFPEQTTELQKPAGMTDEQCGPLPIFRNGEHCISCWRPSWRERLALAFGRPVWLWVWMGNTQPPVALSCESPFEDAGMGVRLLKRKRATGALVLVLLALPFLLGAKGCSDCGEVQRLAMSVCENAPESASCAELTLQAEACKAKPTPAPTPTPGPEGPPEGGRVCDEGETCGCWHRPPAEEWQQLPDCPPPPPAGCVLAGEPSVVAEGQPNTLGDQVNAAMAALRPDCDVGGTCVLGDVTRADWHAQVNEKLRGMGLCAGLHTPSTDEIAVAERATDPWQGFHVFVGSDNDGPVPPGGARRTVKWSPAAYTGAWMPPGTPAPPTPPLECTDPKPDRQASKLKISLKVESWADGTLQTKDTCGYCQAIGMGEFGGVIRCSCPMRSECPGFKCEERSGCESYVAGTPVWETDPPGKEIVLRSGNPWVTRCIGCTRIRVCTEDLRVCSDWKAAP